MTSGGKTAGPARLAMDTSAYSRFRAGDSRVHALIADAEVVFVPATVLGELHGAFELGHRKRDNQVALAEFLREPFVQVATVTSDVARRYGKVYAALRERGRPIPVNDMWIAAAAMDRAACLVTFDRDFEHIAGLDCVLLEGMELDTDEE